MARTEALPMEEYLAHLVLARVRRHAGRPHLTTRIAAALARAAPPSWHGWLALELALAGSLELAAAALATASSGPAVDGARAVLALFDAAGRGDRAAFDAARWADLEALAAALDPTAPIPGGPLGAILSGESDALPGWLAGPATIPRAGEPHALMRVVSRPGHPPRRALAAGIALAPRGVHEVGREAGAKQHRREAALAVLALAGPEGMDKEALFRAVWGFAFVPHLHQGVLDVLLHRARSALGDAAELVRREGRVVMEVRAPIAIVDPRAERPLDDRVLSLVSARGHAARARELAGDLDVPLRTIQAALQRLVDEGECLRDGEGQRVEYRVEDTTFREPTRA
jgi:hypothetical protein